MLTRWLIYHIASGHAFFTGAACLILSACLSPFVRRREFRAARNVLALIGGLSVFVSATPLPPWVYLFLAAVTISWFIGDAFQLRKGLPSSWAFGLRAAVALAWLVAIFAEIPYHLMPRVPPLDDPVIGIIGDSLTAGIGDEIITWPTLLADRHGIEVQDHSQMGANVASALRQAGELSSDERLVLLEIGGNDLLGETTPEEFEAGLDALMSAVNRPGRVVVLFELPLPPTYNAFGRIQRRLARRHGALLVPRRVLLGVLERSGATLDTIHLTQEGHRHMAEVVWGVVRGAYLDRERVDRHH